MSKKRKIIYANHDPKNRSTKIKYWTVNLSATEKEYITAWQAFHLKLYEAWRLQIVNAG